MYDWKHLGNFINKLLQKFNILNILTRLDCNSPGLKRVKIYKKVYLFQLTNQSNNY